MKRLGGKLDLQARVERRLVVRDPLAFKRARGVCDQFVDRAQETAVASFNFSDW